MSLKYLNFDESNIIWVLNVVLALVIGFMIGRFDLIGI